MQNAKNQMQRINPQTGIKFLLHANKRMKIQNSKMFIIVEDSDRKSRPCSRRFDDIELRQLHSDSTNRKS